MTSYREEKAIMRKIPNASAIFQNINEYFSIKEFIPISVIYDKL